MSLSQTAAWASVLGVTEMSDPAVEYRLDKAVGFFNALLERQLAGNTTHRPVRWPGRILRIADGTSISKPGSKGTDWRVHGVYDLGRGGFSHLELTDSHGAEGLCRGAPVPGEVHIADRNYARLRDLRAFLRQGNGFAELIVRLRWKSLTLHLPDGARFDLFEYLRGLPVDHAPHEIIVHARDTGQAEASLPALTLRLIVRRESAKAAQAERKRLRQSAQAETKPTRSAQSRTALVMLATSLTEMYTAEDIFGAYRLRWQVELAIKRMKSLIHTDELPTHTPEASRSWLLSHLLLAALTEEMTQDLLNSALEDLNELDRLPSLWRINRMVAISGPVLPVYFVQFLVLLPCG